MPSSGIENIRMKTKVLIIVAVFSLLGCLDGDSKDQEKGSTRSGHSNKAKLVAFDPDGVLEAIIRWTRYGVPHIEADNLESLAYGTAYAYARDNFCTLSEQILKIRSERSKYFGPDRIPGSGDSEHLISDFGFKALELVETATRKYPTFTENTRAMLEGYAKGFNYYATETGIENLAPECAGAKWIAPVTPQELAAYYVSVNRVVSGARSTFLRLAFFANPGDGNEFMPRPLARDSTDKLDIKPHAITQSDKSHLGSNAWSLGAAATENGRGALLGNPHFPMDGNLRFWQSQLTIPGVLNVNGSSLPGYPIVQLGFNENIAWTHTVSTAEHFAFYQLSLENGRTTYRVNDEIRPIEAKTYTVDVDMGNGKITRFTKDYYYSHHGLMIEAPPASNFPVWNDNTAYSLRDAIANSWGSIDHWLGINLADNLSEFQQSYVDYSGITFVNTIYADIQGNAFYVDSSRVLNLGDSALELMRTDPGITKMHDAVKAFVLPGNTSVFEPDGINNYSQSPKLLRTDFVQNSNDSYWATNPAEPLSAYSILYGMDFSPLSMRTRGSLAMLSDSANSDGKFNLPEIENALLSNRAYLGELILADLLAQCSAQADAAITISSGVAVDINQACIALASWDGRMNKNSTAAHLFREFAYKFNPNKQLSEKFDPKDPANTPNTLTTDGSALKSFAEAVANFDRTDIDYYAKLGDIQFLEKTLASGVGSGQRLPWGGSNSPEGGFNIFAPGVDADTLFPIHSYPPVEDVNTGRPIRSGLSSEGYQVQFGGTWMYVVSFTDQGPSARGLLTSSQSSNSASPHFDDQSKHYSKYSSLRNVIFSELDIKNNTLETLHLIEQK